MTTLFVFALLIGLGWYLLGLLREEKPLPALTEDQIKQKWRELGFFCELDHENKLWTLTGSRSGLLFFPDLLLGYVADPANASDGAQKEYGPYGSLEIRTWPDAGFGHSIHGSLTALAHLAEVVETKLATAHEGDKVRIREEFSPKSVYSLLLDVRADGFDPASTDRERLGAPTLPKKPETTIKPTE